MQKPSVWPWFLLYVASLVVTYLLCAVGGAALFIWGMGLNGPEAFEMMLTGGVLVGVSAPLLAGFVAAPFLPRRKWVWMYDIILIGLGMGSCLWMPLSLYLLIKFLEPEVRDYFGA